MTQRSSWVLLALACVSCSSTGLNHDPSGGDGLRATGTGGTDASGRAAAANGDDVPSAGEPQAPTSSDVKSSAPTSTSAGTGGSRSDDSAGPHESQADTTGTSAVDHPPSQAGSGGAEPAAQSAAGSFALPTAEPRVEVWIGELWSRQSLFCQQEAPFAGPSLPPEGQSERVVLLLDADSEAAAPTGRIRFGEGELPSVPSPEPKERDPGGWSWSVIDSFYDCTSSQLAHGGEYSVLESRRTAERLTFEVAPAEIWQAWCASRGLIAKPCLPPATCTEDPSVRCPCGAGGCQANVGERLLLDFTVDGDSMQTLFEQVGELRLRRVQ